MDVENVGRMWRNFRGSHKYWKLLLQLSIGFTLFYEKSQNLIHTWRKQILLTLLSVTKTILIYILRWEPSKIVAEVVINMVLVSNYSLETLAYRYKH